MGRRELAVHIIGGEKFKYVCRGRPVIIRKKAGKLKEQGYKYRITEDGIYDELWKGPKRRR